MRMPATLTRLLALAALMAVLPVLVIEGSQAAASLADIRVSFKLDPRITQGLFMGERWVSPPTYSRTDAVSGIAIDVKAVGVDSRNKRVKIDATWTIADPEMATISPTQDSKVRITVHKEGESELVVTSDDVSKKMAIKCVQKDGVWRVDISQ